ncbi:MAG TPA: AAA family ATPase [Streptosporangiaceae bacterium]|nr:AAA family ATPase [Streptosporangiaceae bacterium]
MSGLPSGAVTFLFSDIEGSTRLVKALRERYPQVLAEHRRLVRAAIADQGGHEVDTQGDAFFVAFAGAKQAVVCALEIQRALAGHDWPVGAPVRVRIGIHTGHAVPAEGLYTGLAVHRAARICAAARGGQVLVSQATQTIIEDDEEEPGFTLSDVGERTLKDLDRPVRLFQLAAPGLDTRAPPAGHRAGGPAHHMPATPRGAEPRAFTAATRALFFVGRARALSRLLAAVQDAADGDARVVLVTGEAGMGKTTLVNVAAARSGLLVGWGTCAEAGRTPAFWPWSMALRGLLSGVGATDADELTRTDTAELARLLPELGDGPAEGIDAGSGEGLDDTDAARLRLFDAVARLLERLARRHPTLVVLDDLQWADKSSLQLLEFVTQPHRPVPLMIVGAYRHDELGTDTAQSLATTGVRGEVIQLHGLAPDEVYDLVADAVGGSAAERWAGEVHRRTAGHPFLARQLAELLADPARPAGGVPAAAHDLASRRVDRLSTGCRELVKIAAVAGNEVLPDILAEVGGADPATVAALVEEAVGAGVLVRDADGSRALFAHDLFREAIYFRLPVQQRIALHQQIADALEQRHACGTVVVPADLARHCAAAVPLDGAERAIRWARAAARAERARLAFTEAGGHLARARRAIEDSGDRQSGGPLVDLLIEEADARVRAGDPPGARKLLDEAARRAEALGDAERLGRVALGVLQLGARFAMPRDDIIALLETALRALHGTRTTLEAQLTASLARELTHSVPDHRSRARPLSQQALGLARELGDPATLGVCLLAGHDVLWTPGRAAERIDLAREIADLAVRTADPERHAEGVLLTATALLETGSAAFRAALTEYLYLTEGFGQPRHDYMALTRRSALALIDGQLDEARQLIDQASALGERICEPDTVNVRTGQLLVLARACGIPDQLRATAAEAIRCWLGVPAHAHAVAAGLLALAGEPGDLDAARRALDTVTAIGTWRDDRSYLWSLFVGGMATAAARLGDQVLCAQLLAELEPVTSTCGVGGSLVCFVGSNAHWAGIVSGALGRTEQARHWLEQGLAVHRRLGARAWEAESHLELAKVEPAGSHAERAAQLAAELRLFGVTGRLSAMQGAAEAEAVGSPNAELRRDGE